MAINQDRAAATIRATLAIRREKQGTLAKRIGLNRSVLSMFLTRTINLKDEDILKIFDELKINNEKIMNSVTCD